MPRQNGNRRRRTKGVRRRERALAVSVAAKVAAGKIKRPPRPQEDRDP
jgi:hypothetical protein